MTNIVNIEDARAAKIETELMAEAETKVRLFLESMAKPGITNEDIVECHNEFDKWVKLNRIEPQKMFDIFAKMPGTTRRK